MSTESYSSLTLFRTNLLRADKNIKIDSIGMYLDEVASDFSNRGSKSYTKFQFIKHQLYITIRVNLTDSQSTLTTSPESYKKYDYAAIRNFRSYDGGSPQPLDRNPVYYFITKVTLKSQETAELELMMDTLNTFEGTSSTSPSNISWTDRTQISREHKSRFRERSKCTEGASETLYRSVDIVQEGINPQLYRSGAASKIEYTNNNAISKRDWYLIYKAEKPLSDTDLSNPLHCYLLSDTIMGITSGGASSATIYYASIEANKFYYLLKSDNPSLSFTYRGNTYDFSDPTTVMYIFYLDARANVILYEVYQASNGLTATTVDTLHRDNFVFTSSQMYRKGPNLTYDTYEISNFISTTIKSGTGEKTIAFSSLDRTDSTIMQIIQLPYPPDEVSYSGGLYVFSNKWEYDTSIQAMKLKDINSLFELELTNTFEMDNMYKTITFNKNKNKMSDMESKLYSSEFYTHKFLYGNDAKQIYYERFIPYGQGSAMQTAADYRFTLKFKPSSNISSKMLFKISANNSAIYHETDDYSEYLSINRNNQMTLFNNDYLNYMRNGYGYDRSVQSRNAVTSALSSGLGIAGSALGLAMAGAAPAVAGIALGASLVSSLTSLISNQVAGEASIEQKRNELAAQAGSVSGSDDISLLNYYNGNRLLEYVYKPSIDIRNLLEELFFNYGYKCNKIGTPVFNSRYWFNYIECDPEIVINNGSITDEEVEDFKNRYKNGVTIYHYNPYVIIGTGYNFEKTKENWERFLVED